MANVLEALGRCEHEAVVDAGEVPEVEDVVELGGGRRQLENDGVVEGERDLGDDGHDVGDVGAEGPGVSLEDGVENVEEGLLAGEGDVVDVVEGDEARIDLVATAAGLK